METYVCRESELVGRTVRTAPLGHDEEGRPVQAIVLRDGQGVIVAYRNLCRHLPVPLDGGTGELLSEDGGYLLCGTHGALYRLGDGTCVDGPCEGKALESIAVRVRAGEVYVSR